LRVNADVGLKSIEILYELGNISCEDCPPIGGNVYQRRVANILSKAPREHGGALILDELRRVDGRLHQRPVSRFVDRLLAVREEQHDLNRILAGIAVVDSVEEVPHGFEAVRDRG